ncbi:MAG: UDP-N-acetylglucosamine 1-carboxyvinyltransferase [Verrucomicrobiales bacterium]|nr:UDP-N-acetylglucosamine 1-carboxyvinyltransferase [Verrucomicrobiales bacterium]
MDAFQIRGGRALRGEVTISGSKNAALPIMAAALLTREPCVIRRVPNLSDVQFMGDILRSLGAKVEFSGDTVTIEARDIQEFGDYELIRKMRASVCIMGPLLARLRRARVSLPGGCVIGARPIDLHLKGLRMLGAKFNIRGGYVVGSTPALSGAEVFLGGRVGPTVLGTANIMMAATLAQGVTIIESAACEPEVVDLAKFLTSMGARIQGAGSPTLTITGMPELRGAEHDVIPDRIEAATFAIAAAVTKGSLVLKGARADHMGAILDKLREAGVSIRRQGNDLAVERSRRRLRPVDITTQPYAGFPTDVQAQMMVLMLQVPGISVITERIFESRFMHVPELCRLGAQISIEGPSAIVKGGEPLSGAPVMASDLRASAALVLAGLAAEGVTTVKRVYHLDRGYERMDEKLRAVGARIERIPE